MAQNDDEQFKEEIVDKFGDYTDVSDGSRRNYRRLYQYTRW